MKKITPSNLNEGSAYCALSFSWSNKIRTKFIVYLLTFIPLLSYGNNYNSIVISKPSYLVFKERYWNAIILSKNTLNNQIIKNDKKVSIGFYTNPIDTITCSINYSFIRENKQ